MLAGAAAAVVGTGVCVRATWAGDDPPRSETPSASDNHEVSRLHADPETKLLADLTAAEAAYAVHFDPAQFDRDLAAAFRRFGLDLDKFDAQAARDRLGRRASTGEVAAAIDQWARVRRTHLETANWRRLVDVARTIDSDPWRNTLRSQLDRSRAENLPALRTLAEDAGALETQPAASLISLALLIDLAGDRTTATAVLQLATRRFANHFWVWFELGKLSASRTANPDHGEAARCFGKARDLNPRSLEAHLGLGKALADQGKMDEATAAFLEAERLKRVPGATLTDLNQFDQALARIERVKAREADEGFDQNDSGQLTTTQAELTGILFPTKRPIPSGPHTAAGFYNRGIEFARRKEYDKAIADFDKVIKLDHNFASAYVVRGEIWLMKKDFDHAIAEYDFALRLDRQSSAYRGRGFAWLGKKKLALAIDDFNEAIRIAPEDPRSYYGRGYAWSAKEEFEKAKSDFDNAIRLDGLFAPAYVARGHVWTSQKEYDKAIDDFDDAARLDPGGTNAYTGRAYAWTQKREYEKALADYITAIRLEPDDATALNGRAWLWSTCPDAKYRDGKQACESARKACELTDQADAMIIDTLAAANAEAGDFDSAVKWQTKAIELTTDAKDRDEFRGRLGLYQQKKPYRQRSAD